LRSLKGRPQKRPFLLGNGGGLGWDQAKKPEYWNNGMDEKVE
jgi:hypothetical protein